MIKNDPNTLLEKKGVDKSKLSKESLDSLELFGKAVEIAERNPDKKEFQENAEEAGKEAIRIIREDLKNNAGTKEVRTEKAQTKRTKRSESLKVLQEANEAVPDLEVCKEAIRAERKRKIKAGEIKPRQTKTRTEKIQGHYLAILKLNPNEDEKTVRAAEKELRRSATKVLDLYGLTDIELIETGLKEIADKKTKTEEQVQKKAA